MKKRTLAAIAAAAAFSAAMAFSAMAGEWMKDGNGWWFQNDDGSYPAGGLYSIGGKNYAFDAYGYMVENAWYQSPDTGRWYYALGSGELATNQWIGNDYYVGSSGAMMTDTWTPDGYYVGADGKWVPGMTEEQYYSGSPYDLVSSAHYAQIEEPPESYSQSTIDTSGYGDDAGITNWYTWTSDSSGSSGSDSGSSSSSGSGSYSDLDDKRYTAPELYNIKHPEPGDDVTATEVSYPVSSSH